MSTCQIFVKELKFCQIHLKTNENYKTSELISIVSSNQRQSTIKSIELNYYYILSKFDRHRQ